MQIDGYLNTFLIVCIVLVGIKGHQSFYQGLSCTFHIIKDLTGKHSTEFFTVCEVKLTVLCQS